MEAIKKNIWRPVRKTYLKYRKWYENKFIIPQYPEKREIIRSYKLKHGLKTLVETGTFLGDTVEALRGDFGKIYSIELNEVLAEKAKKRFSDNPDIQILQGDSGEVVKQLLTEIHEPCLFWLDGHYSSEFVLGNELIKTSKGAKDTPVMMELGAILSHQLKNHVILIDDARLFTGKSDYPTLQELTEFVLRFCPDTRIEVKRDIIRITR
jgi:hypothetical protein